MDLDNHNAEEEELVAVRTAQDDPPEEPEDDELEPQETVEEPEDEGTQQHWDREKAEKHFQTVHQKTMEALKSYPDAYAGVQATLKGEQPANTQQQFRQDGYEDDGDEILTKKQLLAALEERDRIREQNALSRQVAAEKHQVGRTIDAAAREYGLNQQQYEAAWSEVLTDLPQAEALMSQPGGATAVGRLLAKAMRSQATQSQMQAHVAKTAGKEAEKIRKAQLTAQPEQVAPAADAKKSKRMKFVQQLNESKPQSARDLIGT